MKATPTGFGGLGFRGAVETAFQGLIRISEGCYQCEGLARTACSEGQGLRSSLCSETSAAGHPLPLWEFPNIRVPFGALIVRVLLFEVLY